jgi:hypothetical protein
MEEQIVRAAQDRAFAGSVSCADGHAIAQVLAVSPLEVGRAVNEKTGLRFHRCQLGLFGYGPKAEHKSKIVLPATNLPDEIVAAINEATVQGRISCAAAWEIAERFAYPRLGIANILQALRIKVAPCQLGCF